MTSKPSPGKKLTLEGLAAARVTTNALSEFLRQRLETYLTALRPLFSPSRVFGSLQERRGAVGSSHAFKTLRDRFKEVCGEPFDLRRELEEGALAGLSSQLALEPWEYEKEIESEGAVRKVRVTSPVKWILTYKSDLTLPRLRQVLSGAQERRAEPIREFVVNALAMGMLLEDQPQLRELLADLRFEVALELAPNLGLLRPATITACLPSFLPPDDLIARTTQFSGVPAFIELIDVEELANLADPMAAGLRKIAAG